MICIKIEGMMCQGCVKRVINKLTDLGAKNIEVSLEKKVASFEGTFNETLVKDAIESLGFDYIEGSGF